MSMDESIRYACGGLSCMGAGTSVGNLGSHFNPMLASHGPGLDAAPMYQ